MSAFFELRTYKIYPGKMEKWLKYMEETIIPFQVSKGMIIHGSFTVDSDKNTYVWIRRFKDKIHKEKIAKAERDRSDRLSEAKKLIEKN